MTPDSQIPNLSIKQLRNATDLIGEEVTAKGWIKTLRDQKSFAFIELSDGSSLGNLQVIADNSLIANLRTGASISVRGVLKQSPGGKQSVELEAKQLELLGGAPEDYPLQKKRHSFEFLRTIAHLRPRTNTIGAVMRVRNTLAFATHRFFQERGFFYVHTPIITASDCEGAGEMFRVTTLDPKDKNGEEDFFHQPTYLTVSGQLNGEAYACGMSKIYTFGPTFRAENSNTSRHLAEFWMIEPEIAFADLFDTMEIAADFVKYLVRAVLDENKEDMALFDQWIQKGLIDSLEKFLAAKTVKVEYTEAIEILKASKVSFEYPCEWGDNLQSEHERYLAETHFKSPVFIYNYPSCIKPFYMRINEDGKTVAAMDFVVPGIGELIGGSQREERLDILTENLEKHELDPKTYAWYLDLRRYGTVPHSGFGLGFERIVQYVTGMENIRDVIPFPRAPGSAHF